MEESALLSNIAMIISKDILMDEGNSHKKPKHFLWNFKQTEVENRRDTHFSLLEPDNDEAEDFFLKQQFSVNENSDKTEMPTTSSKLNKKRKITKKLESFNKKHKKLRDNNIIPIAIKKKELNLLNEFENVEFEGFLHMSKMSFLVSFLNKK